MVSFIVTLWTIVGIFNAGPVTTELPCDEVLDFYLNLMAIYGSGSIDFVCIPAPPDAVPVLVLPEPIP